MSDPKTKPTGNPKERTRLDVASMTIKRGGKVVFDGPAEFKKKNPKKEGVS